MDSSMENAIRFIAAELKENPEPTKTPHRRGEPKVHLNPMQTEFLVNKYVLNQ
jgi:hypothetical protein